MGRGPKKHLKRLNAPKHWMLDKLSGKYAPKPSPGPHKFRESLPLIILLRNRLKYALTKREVTFIVMQKLIKVDGKVRTDTNYPSGFMDVVSIDKTNEHFRLLYDTKGRFVSHPIKPEEAKHKLLRIKSVEIGQKGVPYAIAHDGRTIRYPDPKIKISDSVKFDLTTNKITDVLKFENGNLAMITGGRNLGRIGVIERRERHPGSFEVVHVKDAKGNPFATRSANVFVIGKGKEASVSLPKKKGVKISVLEERELRVKGST